jgi:ribonuclease VapC
VIVDSSAIIAILHEEQELEEFTELLGQVHARLSAVTLLESSIVTGPERYRQLDELVTAAELEVVAFDAADAVVAREAHRRFGRGSGSKAQLNFGDCMSYALAKVTGESLLFKGDDFTHTDITPAR